MSAGWVAGVTRARALRSRCLGLKGAGGVAGATTLDDALRCLAATPYRRDISSDASLAEAQRAVSATLLWHLRVLAGWQPRPGAGAVRALAAGFEISNVEAHLRVLTDPTPGLTTPAPYRLGALATAWPRLARTRTPSELRAVLAASAWGDPGDESPAAVATGLRVSAAVRLADAAPEAARWAAGRLALLFGREVFLADRRAPEGSVRRAARLLGHRAVRAVVRGSSFTDFLQTLSVEARWALEGVADAAGLWRAEARWWDVVEQDGHALLRRSEFGSGPVVGAVAVLSADAWRTRGALEVAARGGGSLEAFHGSLEALQETEEHRAPR